MEPFAVGRPGRDRPACCALSRYHLRVPWRCDKCVCQNGSMSPFLKQTSTSFFAVAPLSYSHFLASQMDFMVLSKALSASVSDSS